jgi:hypothetical protein
MIPVALKCDQAVLKFEIGFMLSLFVDQQCKNSLTGSRFAWWDYDIYIDSYCTGSCAAFIPSNVGFGIIADGQAGLDGSEGLDGGGGTGASIYL